MIISIKYLEQYLGNVYSLSSINIFSKSIFIINKLHIREIEEFAGHNLGVSRKIFLIMVHGIFPCFPSCTSVVHCPLPCSYLHLLKFFRTELQG